MAYGDVTMSQVETAVARLGGIEGFTALLASNGLNVKNALQLQGVQAFREWNEDDFVSLDADDMSRLIIAVLRGRAHIAFPQSFVNLAANIVLSQKRWHPSDGWHVAEHRKGPTRWEFEPSQLLLHLSPLQMKSQRVVGAVLSKEMQSLPVFNENLAKFLRTHPERIPSSWKGKRVYFWGTALRNRYSSNLCIPYLLFDGKSVTNDYTWLNDFWTSNDPAVILKE